MKKTPDRKPAAMVRISPEVHTKMRRFLEESGLVQSRWVDRAILAAIPNGSKRKPGKRTKRPAATAE